MRTALKYLLLRGASQGVDLNFAGGVFQLGSTTSATFRGLPGASFSRTDTNGTATALDLAGKVIQFPTRTNSLLQSNTFSNAAWTLTGATVATTTDTLGPDGTLSAWKLAETATTSTHIASQSVTYTAGDWTSSVYVKAAERGFALLSLSGITFVASINLSTGAVSAANGSPTVTATNEGNGWWRVTCSGTVTANTSAVVIYASTDGVFANRSYAGTAGSGIYIAFAQAETGSVATAYIPTTTAAVSIVLPRITNRGLLVEEGRTNLWADNSGAAASVWPLTTSATVGAGTIPGPGAGSVTLITTTGTDGRAQRNITVPNDSLARVFQVFVEKKAGSYELQLLYIGGSSVAVGVTFNGATGAVISGAGTVENAGAYWRVSVVTTNNSTGNTTAICFVRIVGASGQTINVAIPDLQTGSFPTSPIITTGAAGTRGGDQPNLALTFPAEGTILIDYEGPPVGTTVRTYGWSINDAGNDRLTLRVSDVSFLNTPRAVLGDGTTLSTLTTGVATTVGALNRVGVAYTTLSARAAFAQNGSLNTAARQMAASGLSGGVLGIGQNQIGGNNANTYIRRIRIIPRAVSDAELVALTSA